MVTLTEAQISRIGKSIRDITETQSKVQGYVAQYGLDGSQPTDEVLLELGRATPKSDDTAAKADEKDLKPSDYPEFLALLERQKTALNHLLENGDLGCEMDSLKLKDSTMLAPQHLRNLAFLASKAQAMPSDVGEDFFDRAAKQDLHALKGLSATADLVYENIQRILTPPKLGGGSDKKPEWKR